MVKANQLIVQNLQRYNRGATYVCKASNTNLVPPVSSSVSIDMYRKYSPSQIVASNVIESIFNQYWLHYFSSSHIAQHNIRQYATVGRPSARDELRSIGLRPSTESRMVARGPGTGRFHTKGKLNHHHNSDRCVQSVIKRFSYIFYAIIIYWYDHMFGHILCKIHSVCMDCYCNCNKIIAHDQIQQKFSRFIIVIVHMYVWAR